MKARLTAIATSEKCSAAEMDLLDDILEYANGDMRRAVTTLQSVHSLARGGDGSAIIDKAAIAEIVGVPPSNIVDDLWNKGLAQIDNKNPSFDAMQKAVDDVTAEGYSAQLLLSALLPKVTTDKVLAERAKAEIAIRMAEAEKNMIEGADEYLQLMTVCTLAIQWFETSRHERAKTN
jgi:replication factor C subunit 2/4